MREGGVSSRFSSESLTEWTKNPITTNAVENSMRMTNPPAMSSSTKTLRYGYAAWRSFFSFFSAILRFRRER